MPIRKLCALALALLAGGCATDVAPRSAVFSADPGAPGYLIVGLAEESGRCEFGAATQSMALRFKAAAGKDAIAARQGCGLTTTPAQVQRSVLRIAPGSYQPDLVVEILAVFVTSRTLKDDVRNAAPLEVRAGSVAYAGDYVFRSDFDTQEIKLVRVDHDDSAAASALDIYPNLKGAPIVDVGGMRPTR